MADALVEPGLRDQGFLDTAVVTIRYSNGAIAVAEANFSALYGYDVRGEVFGSKGMVQAGRATETAARRYTADGLAADTPRLNVELFRRRLHGRTRRLRRRGAVPGATVRRRRRAISPSRREPQTPAAPWPWHWPASNPSSRAARWLSLPAAKAGV